MKIRHWITHCDTIGDIFKNPAVFELLSLWHYEERRSKLAIKLGKRGEPRFTEELYEFIRSIFINRDSTETFYRFIRETLLENEQLHTSIREKYLRSAITRALLCFEELAKQLSRVECLTIKWIFQQKIADIVMTAQWEPAHNEDDEMFWNVSVFDSIESIMDHGMLPINSDGEILCYLQKGATGHIVNILWDDRIHEVDMFGNSLENEVISEVTDETEVTTRKDIIASLAALERILAYHKDTADTIELSEADEKIYIDYRIEFNGQSGEKDISDALWDIRLWQFLFRKKLELEDELKNTKVSDHTQIAAWEGQWLEAWTSRELPDVVGQESLASSSIPRWTRDFKIVS